MKKINSILLFFVAALILVSCTDEEYNPHMYLLSTPSVSSPSAVKTYILAEASAANVVENYTWSAADFGFPAAVTYTLQFSPAGKSFATPINIVSSGALTYALKTSDLNQQLLALSYKGGTQYAMEGRVKASVSDYSTAVYSPVFTFNVIPYEQKLPPIYLVGDATLGGWDNKLGQPMPLWAAGLYGVVTPLSASKWIKALKTSGAWAPQWGQGTGTWDAGTLAYRATEAATDPPSIPSPAAAGEYYVIFNVTALTYTVTAMPAVVYLVGDGCSAGWTPTAGLAFTKTGVGKYSLTTSLNAAKSLKIMYSNSGAWAPQWGTVTGAISALGKLAWRPNETVADPASIPSPTTAGNYKIELDFNENTYKITTP
jgi:starch-binding outer membrane protein SusE/F